MVSKEELKPVLIIIGNSNVGKSRLARHLISNPKKFKGKSGKIPGTTLLIKKIQDPLIPFDILDLPGFGYMKGTSRRRTEHIRKQIVIYIEKHYKEIFLGIVVVNILRIRDEMEKWFYKNEKSVPLTFEFITFFKEFNIPIVVILNKIDKLSKFDQKNASDLFFDVAKKFGLKPVKYEDFFNFDEKNLPVLLTSALKREGVEEMKEIIKKQLEDITLI